MSISRLGCETDTATVVAALRRDGAVIVENLVEPELVDTVRAELRPELDAQGLRTRSDFNGSLTLRIGHVLAAAPSAAGLVDTSDPDAAPAQVGLGSVDAQMHHLQSAPCPCLAFVEPVDVGHVTEVTW